MKYYPPLSSETQNFRIPLHWLGNVVEADYCPIGYIGGLDIYEYPYVKICEICGSPIQIQKGSVLYIDEVSNYVGGHQVHELWPEDWFNTPYNKFGFQPPIPTMECSNSICQEPVLYLRGVHPLLAKAKKVKIPPLRPVEMYIEAISENERRDLVIAAFLDFEARYNLKITSRVKLSDKEITFVRKTRSRKYYQDNKKKILAYGKKYREKLTGKPSSKRPPKLSAGEKKVRRKAYHAANREEHNARSKAYHAANREKVASRNKAHYEKNKKRILATAKAKYAMNKKDKLNS